MGRLVAVLKIWENRGKYGDRDTNIDTICTSTSKQYRSALI